MIINKILEEVFAAPSFVSILRILNERVTGITGREAARLSGLSSRTAQYVLGRLTAIGVVTRQVGGRDYIYTLNNENFISDETIKTLFQSEKDFKREIYKLIKKKLSSSFESLIVFGSVSRQTETMESDLDLCIVYKNKKSEIDKKLSELRNELFKRYNIKLAPFIISLAEFKKRSNKNSPPVNGIISDSIVIAGKSIRELSNG